MRHEGDTRRDPTTRLAFVDYLPARKKVRLHPSTAALLVRDISPMDVAERSGYSLAAIHAQLTGINRLTQLTFDTIAQLGGVSVALDVCAALDANPMELPQGAPRKATGAARKGNPAATTPRARGGPS